MIILNSNLKHSLFQFPSIQLRLMLTNVKELKSQKLKMISINPNVKPRIFMAHYKHYKPVMVIYVRSRLIQSIPVRKQFLLSVYLSHLLLH